LVQGRFLFWRLCESLLEKGGLNPFGSGTFFIHFASFIEERIEAVLIPLVQGRFLF